MNEPLWLALSRTPRIGPATCRRLWEALGPAEHIFAATRRTLEQLRLRPESIDAIRHAALAIRSAEKLTAFLLSDGIDILTLDSPDYPKRLLDLRDPPPVLYVRGKLPRDTDRTFSVSGLTVPSPKGRDIAHAAGLEMAAAGWTVVSGYALGVDTAAHTGALAAGGTTVLCLPMGIRTFDLRPDFAPFAADIGRRAVLLSECDPDAPWAREHAVRRDRIIAALGQALLVVEADIDGGTVITFNDARRLARPIYVIKYRRAPATAPGNKLLIARGGLPVDSIASLRRILRSDKLSQTAPRLKQAKLF